MTAEELNRLLEKAAHGLPWIYGVDPSAFMVDVEEENELPLVGYFETSRITTDKFGTANPIYEVYVFFDNKFRYERKGVDAAGIEATNHLRKVVAALAPWMVGNVSTYKRFDGDAFGGVSCSLSISISIECDEAEPECEEAEYPETEVTEDEVTDATVIISEDDDRDRYCRYGTLTTLTIIVNDRNQHETSIEFTSGETATQLSVLGEYRHIGDMTILPNTSYLIAVKGGIMVMGEIITEAI